MLVLLFHAGAAKLTGGYIGVDVFFVISGFLISGMITRSADAGEFSFWSFYAKRIARLYPALLCTVALTIAVGVFLLPAPNLAALGSTAAGAVTSTANIVFYLQSGYFDADGATKPLLHTWSLSVEEQFYLVWPAALVAWSVWTKSSRLILIVALGGTSLAMSILHAGSPASFFMMPFRIFEFAVGAMVIWLPRPGRALASTAQTVGLVTIIACAFLFDENTVFPGSMALLPALATSAIIYGGAGFLGPALGWAPMVWLGSISYSLYLVHWPIAVYYGLLFPNAGSLTKIGSILGLSLAFGWLQFYFVEQPLRALPWRKIWRGAAVSSILCVGAGLLIWQQGGFARRFPERIQEIIRAGRLVTVEDAETWLSGRCYLGGAGGTNSRYPDDFDREFCLSVSAKKPNFLVWGDSKAADIIGGLRAAYPEVHFLQATIARCRPFEPATKARGCDKLNRDMLTDILPKTASHLQGVILAANWVGKKENVAGLSRTIESIGRYGVPIYVIGDHLQLKQDVPTLAAEHGRWKKLDRFFLKHRRDFSKTNTRMRKTLKGRATFIDAYALQCDPKCTFFIGSKSRPVPITRDGVHLVPEASKLLGLKIRAAGLLNVAVVSEARGSGSSNLQGHRRPGRTAGTTP